jgi:hypothetical protein
MAGTLVANTINTDTGVFSTNNAYSGIAKAWVSFNGTTAAVNKSFNVSSITRASAGVYSLTFTTAMPDANYAAVVSCSSVLHGTYGFFANINGNTSTGYVTPTTTTMTVTSGYTTVPNDETSFSVTIFD